MIWRSLTLAAGDDLYDVRIAGPDREGAIEFTVVAREEGGTAPGPRSDQGEESRSPGDVPRSPDGPSAQPLRARLATSEGEMRIAPLAREGAPLRCAVSRDGRGVWVGWSGRTVYLEPAAAGRGRARPASASRHEVRAPMTGTLVEIRATPGARVAADEVVAIMEAMKMEYRLRAPREGEVREVAFAPGDRVELGAVVVRLAHEPDASPKPAS